MNEASSLHPSRWQVAPHQRGRYLVAAGPSSKGLSHAGRRIPASTGPRGGRPRRSRPRKTTRESSLLFQDDASRQPPVCDSSGTAPMLPTCFKNMRAPFYLFLPNFVVDYCLQKWCQYTWPELRRVIKGKGYLGYTNAPALPATGS